MTAGQAHMSGDGLGHLNRSAFRVAVATRTYMSPAGTTRHCYMGRRPEIDLPPDGAAAEHPPSSEA
jgi:hypothetical protein